MELGLARFKLIIEPLPQGKIRWIQRVERRVA